MKSIVRRTRLARIDFRLTAIYMALLNIRRQREDHNTKAVMLRSSDRDAAVDHLQAVVELDALRLALLKEQSTLTLRLNKLAYKRRSAAE